MKIPPITDDATESPRGACPWIIEGADDSPSREIHSATGWHLATVTPSGALSDNSPLFELLRAAPELAQAVLDLIDRYGMELEDEDDLTDVTILETAYELLRRLDQ